MNSENKENLSNYQLLKRKPSVCSIPLHLSKVFTVVQFFFAWHRFHFPDSRGSFPGVRWRKKRDLCHILVPRGRAPFGQHQESRPLAMSNTGNSRTSRHSAHVQSQVWQIWLVVISIYCVYKAIQKRNVVGRGQRSRFLVLTKRSAASGNENAMDRKRLHWACSQLSDRAITGNVRYTWRNKTFHSNKHRQTEIRPSD